MPFKCSQKTCNYYENSYINKGQLFKCCQVKLLGLVCILSHGVSFSISSKKSAIKNMIEKIGLQKLRYKPIYAKKRPSEHTTLF